LYIGIFIPVMVTRKRIKKKEIVAYLLNVQSSNDKKLGTR